MAKWAIELGEHEIEFQVRHSIKGQVLADFIAETTGEETETTSIQVITPTTELEEWKLFTDGASCSEGSGVGLLLVSPKGKEYTYALRFEFNTTNNEAEYEALLAGLRLAREMNISYLKAYVDSYLVANQVSGTFEARHPTIQLYLSRVKELAEQFKSYVIGHVRRSQNKKADALSKLASITFEHLAKEVLVETLGQSSIEEKEVNDLIPDEDNTWMKPLKEYLRSGFLPTDKKEARKIRIKAPCYKLLNDRLFGIPQEIVSDNRKQFTGGIYPGFCKRMKIKQTFTSVYHPQGNGQVEVTNKEIIKGIEKRLGKSHEGWVEELPLVLWAHRTTSKKSNGETPYSLVYGMKVVLPAEIQVLSSRTATENNEGNLHLYWDLAEERREAALIREASYKKSIERYYNKRVKRSTFKFGDHVLGLNSTSKVEYEGKLGRSLYRISSFQKRVIQAGNHLGQRNSKDMQRSKPPKILFLSLF
ncbi:uncharacterized protein [Rutidosis leptorrhynchoides]|uniref:uncharacterized protein n=1 Tax=Rutidosis leptorrhynchoides TaxID=125765 RepID=UPI003A998215